jgi:hypothetical protein
MEPGYVKSPRRLRQTADTIGQNFYLTSLCRLAYSEIGNVTMITVPNECRQQLELGLHSR